MNTAASNSVQPDHGLSVTNNMTKTNSFLLVVWLIAIPFCIGWLLQGYAFLMLGEGDAPVFLGMGSAEWMPAAGAVGGNNSALHMIFASLLCLILPWQLYMALNDKTGPWRGTLTDVSVIFAWVMGVVGTTYLGGHAVLNYEDAAVIRFHVLYQSMGFYEVLLVWTAYKMGQARMKEQVLPFKRWSVRFFAFGTAMLTATIFQGLWSLGGGFGVSENTQLVINGWGCYAIPFVIAEVIARRHYYPK